MSNNFYIFGPLALIVLLLVAVAAVLFFCSFFQRDPAPKRTARALTSDELVALRQELRANGGIGALESESIKRA